MGWVNGSGWLGWGQWAGKTRWARPIPGPPPPRPAVRWPGSKLHKRFPVPTSPWSRQEVRNEAIQGSGVSKTHPTKAWKTLTVCHFIKSKETVPVYRNLRNTEIERKETGSSRSHWPWKRTCCVWFSPWGLLVHIYKCPSSKAEFLNTQNSQPFTLVLLGPYRPSIPSSEQSRPFASPTSV